MNKSREEWTYSYIDNLEILVKKIKSLINRVTKLALNKVAKKAVQRLVSPSAQTSILQKPELYIGDFARIFQNGRSVQKGIQTIL